MSGASSLRNAVKRIAHKERAQPSDRKKFGLLEKHKDYIERSKDFKKKKKTIETLRKKASERNPDEFYFRMHNSQVVNGKHQDKSTKKLDKETVDLLKTQDLAYIFHKKAVDDKKIEKLKQNLQLIGDVNPRSHRIFVENERQLEAFDPASHFSTLPELVDRNYNRIHVNQLEKCADPNSFSVDISGKKRKKSAEMDEIQKRSKRSKKLTTALSELSLQRNLARGKGTVIKSTVTKTIGANQREKEMTVYKWKRQRSR